MTADARPGMRNSPRFIRCAASWTSLAVLLVLAPALTGCLSQPSADDHSFPVRIEYTQMGEGYIGDEIRFEATITAQWFNMTNITLYIEAPDGVNISVPEIYLGNLTEDVPVPFESGFTVLEEGTYSISVVTNTFYVGDSPADGSASGGDIFYVDADRYSPIEVYYEQRHDIDAEGPARPV